MTNIDDLFNFTAILILFLIFRLTNLNSLNRTIQLSKSKLKSKREGKSGPTSEAGSGAASPAGSDHYDELEPSEDEGANVDDEVAPPVVSIVFSY